MMERRVLLAALLSAIVMVSYARIMGFDAPRPAAAKVETSASPNAQTELSSPGAGTLYQRNKLPDEELLTLENPALLVEIGKKTAAVRRVVLKQHRSLEDTGAVTFNGMIPISRVIFPEEVQLVLEERGGLSAKWNLEPSGDKYQQMVVQLDDSNPLISFMLSYSSGAHETAGSRVDLLSTWEKADQLPNRYNMLEIIALTTRTQAFQREYLRYAGLQRSQKSVPRGTQVLTLADRYFCQSINFGSESAKVKVMAGDNGHLAALAELSGNEETEVAIYLGSRDFGALRSAGFQRAFPLGFLGWVGLCLLWGMHMVAVLTKNYGIAIIVFSALISCMLAPFTLLGMRSMKKLQAQKPEIDKLMAKHKANPQKANLEVMQLYREHKVSPMGGCLPMFIQFPILMALFRTISHFIELRGARFLWIKDLSLPDRAATIPWSLPILGNHLNILPIVMTGAMLVQMKLSQQRMPQDSSNPMAKAMSGPTMAIIFGVMFYQFPAGLVLYWLTSTLVNIAWYRTV